MSLSINTNISSLNAHRNLVNTQNAQSTSIERLSSGFRINRAADDAAGLAISEGLRSQIGGLRVAVRNAQDGISVVQTAEGGLTETHSILQRIRNLAVQSSNDSNDADSRSAINAEASALAAELTRIADKTTFNNVKLLDGGYANKDFQVGSAAGDTIKVDIVSKGIQGATAVWDTPAATAAAAVFTVAGVTVTTGNLTASTNSSDIATQLNDDANFAATFSARVTEAGALEVRAKDANLTGTISVTGGLSAATTSVAASAGSGGFSASDLGLSTLDLSTKAGATSAMGTVDAAIKSVSNSRASLGALQNRFQHTINSINVSVENLSASESRIRDTDMAAEMVNFSRSQILSQVGTAMLAQANQSTQSVLSLLR